MSEPFEQKQKKIALAQQLYSELLIKRDDMPPPIKKELEAELKSCQDKRKQRPTVTFCETKIILPDGNQIPKRYPLVLLESLILEGRIHWLWGFVLLGSWSVGIEVLDNHPKVQFSNTMSKRKKELGYSLFTVIHARGGDEWFLDYEQTGVSIKCNLLEARQFYNSAEKNFKSADYRGAVSKLEKAILLPGYNRVNYINAHNLLIKCMYKLNYEGISEKLLCKTASFLRWYKFRLRDALICIEKTYIKKGIIDKSTIEAELDNMTSALKNANEDYVCIAERAIPSEKEKDFVELISLILDIKEIIDVLEEETDLNRFIKEKIFEFDQFQALLCNKHIREIFKIQSKSLHILNSYKHDKDGTEKHLLINLFLKGVSLDNMNDIGALKSYLNTGLKLEIRRMKGYEI